MNINPFEQYSMVDTIPNNVLTKEGSFTILGLKVMHNGRGRVVITDLSNSTVYSDCGDYYSTNEVIGVINNIIELKWGSR